jgi:hypothetical protein
MDRKPKALLKMMRKTLATNGRLERALRVAKTFPDLEVVGKKVRVKHSIKES